ncbi:small glutamine-rich tetratricopeptide repeat-containing protein alpha [Prionailurus iriomotensis]
MPAALNHRPAAQPELPERGTKPHEVQQLWKGAS